MFDIVREFPIRLRFLRERFNFFKHYLEDVYILLKTLDMSVGPLLDISLVVAPDEFHQIIMSKIVDLIALRALGGFIGFDWLQNQGLTSFRKHFPFILCLGGGRRFLHFKGSLLGLGV